ncbi:MAG: single-stranded DNA-binding protein [Bacteroidota bacterium]
MAKYGLNRATLIGKVGADPQLAYTEKGIPRVTLRLAVTTPQVSGDPTTDWMEVQFEGDLAEQVIEQVKKTSLVYVEAQLKGTTLGSKVSNIYLKGGHFLLLSASKDIGQDSSANFKFFSDAASDENHREDRLPF